MVHHFYGYRIKVITLGFDPSNIGSIPIRASSSLFGVKDAQGSSKALVRVQILGEVLSVHNDNFKLDC